MEIADSAVRTNTAAWTRSSFYGSIFNGSSSASHFARAFRKENEMSPTVFRTVKF